MNRKDLQRFWWLRVMTTFDNALCFELNLEQKNRFRQTEWHDTPQREKEPERSYSSMMVVNLGTRR